MATPKSIIAARKEARSACKAALRFVGIKRFRVLWLRDGKECRSPWFASRERASQAREAIARKYAQAIIYVD